MSFKEHIQYVAKKLKVVLCFYYRNKSCFSFMLKKRLVESTFLPVLDYGDVLYMRTSAELLQKLDSVYHGALRFISNCGFLTHHCSLYSILSQLDFFECTPCGTSVCVHLKTHSLQNSRLSFLFFSLERWSTQPEIIELYPVCCSQSSN